MFMNRAQRRAASRRKIRLYKRRLKHGTRIIPNDKGEETEVPWFPSSLTTSQVDAFRRGEKLRGQGVTSKPRKR